MVTGQLEADMSEKDIRKALYEMYMKERELRDERYQEE